MKPSSDLYRGQALRAGRLRWFGPVHVVLPPSTRSAVLFALSAFAALLGALVVVEIPDSVPAHGVLLPAEGLLKIRAQRAGRVEGVSTRTGDAVDAGDVLLRISGLQRAPGARPALAGRIDSLQRERGIVLETFEHDAAAARGRIETNGRRAEGVLRRIDAARAEQQTRQQTGERLGMRAERVSNLAASGVVAQHAVDELTAAAMQARAASLASAQHVGALEDELIVLEERLRQDEELTVRLRNEAEARVEAIDREIDASAVQSSVVVASPDAGRVASLVVRDGDVVQPGQVLLTIYDPADRLEARLYVPAGRAGMIAAGQRVELQLDAFPHELYGTRPAVVTSVAAAAMPAAEIATILPVRGPVFEIRAALSQQAVRAGGRSWALPPGTTFRAGIVRRRWPLYRWLLRDARDDAPAE